MKPSIYVTRLILLMISIIIFTGCYGSGYKLPTFIWAINIILPLIYFCRSKNYKPKLKKRTWHYLQNPAHHEITCQKCHGSNLDWSEYEGHVWCYDCNIDFTGYNSVLSGPVAIHLAAMLGISTDRYDLKTKKISHYDLKKDEFIEMTIDDYKKICKANENNNN